MIRKVIGAAFLAAAIARWSAGRHRWRHDRRGRRRCNRDIGSRSAATFPHLEAGTSEPRRATLEVVRRAFEKAGVELIDENGGGPGVRLRKSGKEKPRK
jgi:hypothetical protein